MLCCISEPEINCNSRRAFLIASWVRVSGVLSLVPSSRPATLRLCWGRGEDLSGVRVAATSLEMSLKEEKGEKEPRGAFSLLPCKGFGVLQRCFAGKWMNVFQAVPGIHLVVGESVFGGRFRAEQKARLRPPEQEVE